jgi:protein-tyrosine phosphatase
MLLCSSNFSAAMPESILCVCLGNICRSPTAEEVLRQKFAMLGNPIRIDSAGTSDAHTGQAPDKRAQQHAKARGYNLSKLTARGVTSADFYDFDLMLAMDEQNLADLQIMRAMLPEQDADGRPLANLALFSEHDPNYCGQAVPDPYYGDDDDFERVLDQIESSADAWATFWQCYG